MKSIKYLLVALFAITILSTVNAKKEPKARVVEEILPEEVDSIVASDVTAADVFESLTSPALDVLPKSLRLDMLDYYDAGISKTFLNSYEGVAKLDTVARNYIRVKPSAVSSVEILILPYKKDNPLVMTLYTVGAESQAPDTDIRFYDSGLRPLSRDKFWKEPKTEQFLNLSNLNKQDKKNVLDLVPFPTFLLQTVPADNTLKATLTIGDYLSNEDYKTLQKFIKKPILFKWNGKRFVAEK